MPKKLSATERHDLVGAIISTLDSGELFTEDILEAWRRDADGRVIRDVLIRWRNAELGAELEQMRVRAEMRAHLTAVIDCAMRLDTTSVPDPTDPHAVALRRRHVALQAMAGPGPVREIPGIKRAIGIEAIEDVVRAARVALGAIPDEEPQDAVDFAERLAGAGLSTDDASTAIGMSPSWLRTKRAVAK